MNDKQQSAVDFLVEHLKEYGFDLSCHTLEINQAKELFKQQIIDARVDGAYYSVGWSLNKKDVLESSKEYLDGKFKS